ncbi:MAG: hypothetical protein UCH28_07595, partial [Adlercreutzia sp.]|nr:hypothetical protein [Adlercreutzia sp.]
VGAVIDVALGKEPPAVPERRTDDGRASAVRFVFGPEDVAALEALRAAAPERLEFVSEMHAPDHEIVDSGSRYGFFIFSGDTMGEIEEYLPEVGEATAVEVLAAEVASSGANANEIDADTAEAIEAEA